MLIEAITANPLLRSCGGLGGIPSRDGLPYQAHTGIALEPQFHLGSPNHAPQPPQWPDCILRPGSTWRSQSRFQFFIA